MSSAHRACSFGPILRIKASANDHPAEVPEAMLTANNEKRLVKIWMVLPQLLLLNFSAQSHKHKNGRNTSYCVSQNQLKQVGWSKYSFTKTLFVWTVCFLVQKPFHLCLLFLFLDHLNFTVLSLRVAVAYCAGMLGKETKDMKYDTFVPWNTVFVGV